MELKTKVYVIGTYEGVAEAAMQLLRADALSSPSSEGIRDLADDAPGLYLLEVSCNEISSGTSSFCQRLSTDFKTLLVGTSVAAKGINNIQNDQVVWGVGAFIDGTDLIQGGLTGSVASSLPEDIAALAGENGALPSNLLPRLHEIGLDRCRMEATARLLPSLIAKSDKPRLGFPRWSLLTHAVNARGADGLVDCLNASRLPNSRISDGQRLVSDASQARAAGVASWADTLFFGSRTPEEHDKTLANPFSDADERDCLRRRQEVLRSIGNGTCDPMLAAALIHALSSPQVTLQDGSHPLPLLTRSIGYDRAERIGLNKLIDAVHTHGHAFSNDYSDFTGGLIRAVIDSGYSAESVRLSMAFGVSPGFIASSTLPLKSTGASAQCDAAAKLMDAFKAFFKTLSNFAPELVSAFKNSSDTIAQTFDAKVTEESMSSAIEGWVGASRAGTPDVKVVIKQRRRIV